MARPWWDPKRPAGFRLSARDAVVILLCAAATWLLWSLLGRTALLIPVTLGHFFLFCNVFRVGRRAELAWAGIFIVNAALWLWFDAFSVLRVVLAQTPVTVAAIMSAVLNKDYRGIGCRISKAADLKTLYRPVGPKELALIQESGMRGFPPRLPEQPIFYPVLNRAYAVQIARDWNVRDSGAGFVTEFDVEATYLACFEEKVVGGDEHRELWVPAEELEEFNRHIVGPIRIVDAFYRDDYDGPRVSLESSQSAREGCHEQDS